MPGLGYASEGLRVLERDAKAGPDPEAELVGGAHDAIWGCRCAVGLRYTRYASRKRVSSFLRSRRRSLRWPARPCLLGRMTWIPVYNYAYVLAQQRFGDASPIHEGLGLLVGSLAASYVASSLICLQDEFAAVS